MRFASVILTAALLVSCNRQQPKLSDEQVQKLRMTYPGMTDACVDKARWGGIEALPDDWEQCFRWGPQQRWSGLYVTGFEWSRFCPAPARECSARSPGEFIDLDESPAVKLPGYEGEESPPVYDVEFVGRKTVFPMPGPDGPKNEIIVDRLISMKKLKK